MACNFVDKPKAQQRKDSKAAPPPLASTISQAATNSALAASKASRLCEVCKEPEKMADDPIYCCKACGLLVHRSCYGVIGMARRSRALCIPWHWLIRFVAALSIPQTATGRGSVDSAPRISGQYSAQCV